MTKCSPQHSEDEEVGEGTRLEFGPPIATDSSE